MNELTPKEQEKLETYKHYLIEARKPKLIMGDARKHNRTGIAGLSIGTTKNDRGTTLTRYIVNKPKPKSFYFGVNKTQKQAFNEACQYLADNGLLGDVEPAQIYKEFEHEKLI